MSGQVVQACRLAGVPGAADMIGEHEVAPGLGDLLGGFPVIPCSQKHSSGLHPTAYNMMAESIAMIAEPYNLHDKLHQ